MRMPDDYQEEHNLEMSNFDHSIDDGLSERLQEEKCFARHSGWEFNGLVWFEDNQFHEEVWRYRVYQETINANTLPELMKMVNDKYGWK